MSDVSQTTEPVHTGLELTHEQRPVMCEQCRVKPVRAPRGKVVARFCSSRCRAAWHNARKREAWEQVRRELGKAKDQIDRALETVALLFKGPTR